MKKFKTGEKIMETEKTIANEIMGTIKWLRLPLYLDKITEGKGNCFPLALIAQCRREDIFMELTDELKSLILKDNSILIRLAVKKFMMNPKYDVIKDYKRNFEELVAPIDGHSWSQYWDIMSEDKVWVDSTFIQGAAWLLNHDIIIVTTTSTRKNPFIRVNGNRSNRDLHSEGTPLILGCKSQSHYQSLLTTDKWIFKQPISDSDNTEKTPSKLCWPQKEKQHEVKSGDKENNSYSNIPMNKQSKRDVKETDLTNLPGVDTDKLRSNHAKAKAKWRANCRLKDIELYKRNEAMRKARSDARLRAIDNEKVKDNQRKRRAKCDSKSRASNNEQVKKNQTKRRENCDKKSRALDNDKVKECQRKRRATCDNKSRALNNEQVKEDQRKRVEKYEKKSRAWDNEQVKDIQRKRKRKSDSKLRAIDNIKVKLEQTKRREQCDKNSRALDNEEVKDFQRKRKRKSDLKLRTLDHEKFKNDQKKRKADSDRKLRESDNKRVKEDQNKRKERSDAYLKGIDEARWRGAKNFRQKLSRKKMKDLNPLSLAKYEIAAQKNKQKNWDERDRLRDFRNATMYNAIFICNCCHRRLFIENVEMITSELISSLNKAKEGIFRRSTDEKIEIFLNGKKNGYVCKTCLKHMKAKRMPPMSVKNRLILEKQDENMQLTELEGSLIAKDIIFQKIYQLPKSRWTALSDKIINVPIHDEDIMNTVAMLPRTPKEAKLIGVSLKRKLEYKNTHIRQLVDTNKVVKMLELLKAAGNPYYQFYNNVTEFKKRCESEDPEGYSVLFPDNDGGNSDKGEHTKPLNNECDNDSMMNLSDEDNDDEELEDELDFVTNDPVRKYQFKYDDSVCMANKYPEVRRQLAVSRVTRKM